MDTCILIATTQALFIFRLGRRPAIALHRISNHVDKIFTINTRWQPDLGRRGVSLTRGEWTRVVVIY